MHLSRSFATTDTAVMTGGPDAFACGSNHNAGQLECPTSSRSLTRPAPASKWNCRPHLFSSRPGLDSRWTRSPSTPQSQLDRQNKLPDSSATKTCVRRRKRTAAKSLSIVGRHNAMRWNVFFAAVLTVGLCNCSHGFEFLNRMLGTSSHYDGCTTGCCGTPSCDAGCGCKCDALTAKYGCPAPACPCNCEPNPRSYRCIKICIPRITLPCPKIFCSTECYKPQYIGCGCGSDKCCHGYHYGGYGGYGCGCQGQGQARCQAK